MDGNFSTGVGAGAFVKYGCFNASAAVIRSAGLYFNSLLSRSNASSDAAEKMDANDGAVLGVNSTKLANELTPGQSSSVGVPSA